MIFNVDLTVKHEKSMQNNLQIFVLLEHEITKTETE